MLDAIRFHHEQSVPDACVAACICMIHRMRGVAVDETAVHTPHAGIGLVLTVATTRRLPIHDIEEIRLSLRTDEVVAVIVHGPPYVRWQEAAYPTLASLHGKLCPPGGFGGPLHAVLLVHWDGDGFVLLDPYFGPHGQPLSIAEDALMRCYSGQAVAAAI